LKRANSNPAKRISKAEGGSTSKPNQTFLVVAVGASAGGIEAFTELVHDLPSDTGMAFVLVQHLDPKHRSMLTELLSRQTKMSVVEVADGMHLAPNHVYVIPPNATMSLTDHTLKLAPRADQPGNHMPIDHFMRSLAEEQGTRAVGVILSGFGSDGTLGLAEIQAQGGVTFAQDEDSAKYDSMPRSAIASGYVDYVLPPKDIAQELTRIAQHPYVGRTTQPGMGVVSSDTIGVERDFPTAAAGDGSRFHPLPPNYDSKANRAEDGGP
jgi:two-component system, chemotaxis family, CheB/CheR fusion protein